MISKYQYTQFGSFKSFLLITTKLSFLSFVFLASSFKEMLLVSKKTSAYFCGSIASITGVFDKRVFLLFNQI